MKKFILMFFALFFSVSSILFAYKRWSYLELEDDAYYYCYDEGGTCLLTVIVEEQPAP